MRSWSPRTLLGRLRRVARAGSRHVSPAELLAFMDGELSEADAAECASHLEACWTCRAERDDIARTIDLVVLYRNRSLSRHLPPPPAARSRFLQALAARRAEPVARTSPWALLVSWTCHPSRLTVGLMSVVVVVCVILVLKKPPTARLSAAEVLRRADARIAALVKPGGVFYRRWSSVLTVTPPAAPPSRIERVCEEWAEGGMPNRLASRTEDPNGRLVEAVWTLPENGQRRLFYYNAGDHQLGASTGASTVPDRGAVFRWPTHEEIERDLLQFPDRRRAMLQFAFDFAQMEPVVMEHRFPAEAERFAASFTTAQTSYDGKPGIRVTLHIPKAAVFDLGGGRFKAFVGDWSGTYTYDAETYLLQSFDGSWAGTDGWRARYQLRLDQCRVVPVASHLFTFMVPPATQEISLTATDVLAEIDRAFFDSEGVGPQPPPVKAPAGRIHPR